MNDLSLVLHKFGFCAGACRPTEGRWIWPVRWSLPIAALEGTKPEGRLPDDVEGMVLWSVEEGGAPSMVRRGKKRARKRAAGKR